MSGLEVMCHSQIHAQEAELFCSQHGVFAFPLINQYHVLRVIGSKAFRRTTVLLDVGQRRSGKISVTVWRANT